MKRQSPERTIHLAVLAYLRRVLHGNPVIHHSANEIGLSGKDVARHIANAKHMGLVPGYPDLVCHTFHGDLFFEVKSEGNGLTPAQRAVHADLARLNRKVAVVRSIEDVREHLAKWGIPTRETHPEQWEPMP